MEEVFICSTVKKRRETTRPKGEVFTRPDTGEERNSVVTRLEEESLYFTYESLRQQEHRARNQSSRELFTNSRPLCPGGRKEESETTLRYEAEEWSVS